MSFRFARGVLTTALVMSLGLVVIPACKKKPKATEPSPSNSTPAPGSTPVAPDQGSFAPSNRDPGAPHSPIFNATTEAPMRAAAQGNLKQIMLALHNFNDANGALPAGYADKTGKPGLSWRVAILPYLELDSLFKQFKLDEAWDSPHNKALISKMPPVFAPPRQSTNGYTFYRGFTGPNTWLPPQQTAKPGQLLLGVKLFQIPDGTSNTILVAEAYDPVIWTKPDELPFAPDSVPRLGGVFSTGFHAGMGDGSVKFVRNGVSAAALANAIQINDGKPVDLDQ